MPENIGLGDGFIEESEIILEKFCVSERQLVRYADEVLQQEYGVSALMRLVLLWSAYRTSRGTTTDPLRCVGCGAAALAYYYMLLYGPKPNVAQLAKTFGCDIRQLVYYAKRIAGVLEKSANAEDGQGCSTISTTQDRIGESE